MLFIVIIMSTKMITSACFAITAIVTIILMGIIANQGSNGNKGAIWGMYVPALVCTLATAALMFMNKYSLVAYGTFGISVIMYMALGIYQNKQKNTSDAKYKNLAYVWPIVVYPIIGVPCLYFCFKGGANSMASVTQ
jgi:steroid 5-alpha reductase family enzyme